MTTCLIVIDAQASFRQRPYFTVHDLPAYINAQNTLIDSCVARGVPIVQIFHVDGSLDARNPFALASGHVQPLAELSSYTPAATFYKNRHSALVGTGLGVWLRQNAISRIIISGIRTEQCCETTARHASDEGYSIDYVLDATLTWDMQQPDGQTLSAADLKMRTATVLEGRFASVCSVQTALERASA